MKIVSVSLTDAKSYSDATIHLKDGTNAICGRNGAGKSTILEAIGFTLFDYLQTPQASFVRKGRKTATVDVLVEKDGLQFDVIRSCGGSSRYAIYNDDGQITDGKAETIAYLHELLGVQESEDLSAIFRDAVGVPQGLLTSAFLETPANRKRTFGPLLHVDDYESAWSKLREAEKILSTKEADANVRIARLEAESDPLEQEKHDLSMKKALLLLVSDELESATTDRSKVIRELSDMDRAEGAVTGAKDALLRMGQKVAVANERSLAADAVEQSALKALTIVSENRESSDEYVATQDELERAQSTYVLASRAKALADATESKIESIEAQIAGLLSRIAEADEAATNIHKVAPLVSRHEALRTEVEQLKMDKREAEHARKLAAECKRAVADAEVKLTRTTEYQEELESLRADLSLTESELRKGEIYLASLKEEGITAKAAIATLYKRIEALSDGDSTTCYVCGGDLSPEHRAELLETSVAAADKLREEKRRLSSLWVSAQHTVEASRTAISGYEKRIAAITALPGVDEVQQAVDERKNALATANKSLLAYEDIDTKIEDASSQLLVMGDPSSRLAVLKSLVAKKPGLVKQTESLETELDDVGKALADVTVAASGLDFAKRAVDAVKRSSIALKPAYEMYMSKIAEAETYTATFEAAAALYQALHTAKEEAAYASQAFDEIQEAYDSDSHSLLKEKLSELQISNATLSQKVDTLKLSVSSMEANILHLEAKTTELEAEVAAREVLYTRMHDLQFLRQTIRDAGPEITKMLVASISITADRLFGDIVQDASSSLEWTEDYDIVVSMDGQQRHFNQLSGGEQMSAALSVRLALLSEISSIDFAFFDEPTVNLDAQRRESLAAQIMNVKGFSQLFVISHDDSFEQGMNHAVKIVKVNGESEVAS